VDDDIDSALLVESVFAHLGCRTACSLTSVEARKKICSWKADVIILDWVLGPTDAKGVVNQCIKVIDKFGVNGVRGHKPKIITYSSLALSEIDALENPYFEHLDHWKKPISQRELLTRSLALLERIEA